MKKFIPIKFKHRSSLLSEHSYFVSVDENGRMFSDTIYLGQIDDTFLFKMEYEAALIEARPKHAADVF